MFKKWATYFSLLLFVCQLSFATQAHSSALANLFYSDQLQEVVAIIQKLPEAVELIKHVQKEGTIRILASKNHKICQQFGACWDPNQRIIFVNWTSARSKGSLIASILFELHNALVNSKMNDYDQLAAKGLIEKEAYVRSIEYLEYQNTLKTSKLIQKGIALGIFPTSAYLPTYRSFEEHYYFQKISGHSAYIAYNYHQLAFRFLR